MYTKIIKDLRAQKNPKNIAGMARFGISTKGTLGISTVIVRNMAKKLKKEDPKTRHALAAKLWKSGIHEARLLAGFIDVPELVSEQQMERWIKDFDSWDTCDQICGSLFDKTKFAWKKPFELVKRKREFEKRTGFVLMATLAVHDKKATNKQFEKFFPLLILHSQDERNFVKKAINWALRQLGKRNLALNRKAIRTAKKIQRIDNKSARWVANDALKELQSEAVQKRLRKK
jgi:3-methyladenine DNA glycosylase AlkD